MKEHRSRRCSSAQRWLRSRSGRQSELPHGLHESVAVRRSWGIDDRRDLAEILRPNIRRIHDKGTRSGRIGVAEAMNHSARGSHGIAGPQVARLASHGIAQNALQHVYQLFIIRVAVRRRHIGARRHSHFEAPHLTAVPGLLDVSDFYLSNPNGLRVWRSGLIHGRSLKQLVITRRRNLPREVGRRWSPGYSKGVGGADQRLDVRGALYPRAWHRPSASGWLSSVNDLRTYGEFLPHPTCSERGRAQPEAHRGGACRDTPWPT